jgi:predicted nucleic acid-binding protein
MTILDTNVLSALMLQTPDAKVVAWLDRQPRTSIWTTSVTLLEVRFGLQIMSVGKRRQALLHAFEALLASIGHRIVPFDASAAEHAGDLMASRQKQGRPGDLRENDLRDSGLRDIMIAGIALAHNATLATRNTAHFADASVSLVDPWNA